jgi:hypothetical protein
MRIKGADGHEYDVASSGVGGTGLGLGIAGTALGLLNGGGGGLLGGLFGGNNNHNCGCSDNMLVNRYELAMQQQIAAKDAKIGLLESNIYTDQKLADVYERLNVKINAVKDAQDAINLQQAVYNGTNTAALNCMQGQIAQLYSLTKLVVPNTSVCPGWGNVTVAPATTPATV